ncbi:MAG: sulfotransferase [Phycisphaerales bacterium]|nr:sulfotransferase [Phycisphaerales bacterium]
MTPDERPIFATSVARSGGTLLCAMLSAHPELAVASEPLLPLYRSFRNAVVAASAARPRSFDPAAPLSDAYYRADDLAVMDLVREATLAVPVPPAERSSLAAACRARAAHQAPDLAATLDDGFVGSTYLDTIRAVLRRLGDARRRARVGLKDAWHIDCFEAVARSFPQARFIVLLRDPRAAVASMLAVARTDPEQVGDVLSYARHWRRLIAWLLEELATRRLGDRLLVVRYEDLVTRPEAEARRLCAFLGAPFDARMLHPREHAADGTATPWTGNSSFVAEVRGISSAGIDRWRHQLDPTTRRVVELVCGPDMPAAGYEPDETNIRPDGALVAALVDASTRYAAWRTTLGDPSADLGAELLRRALLALDGRTLDDGVLRRAFLFRSAHEGLRAGTSVVPAASVGEVMTA